MHPIGALLVCLLAFGALMLIAYITMDDKNKYDVTEELLRNPELKLKNGGNEEYHYQRRHRR